MVLQKAGSYLEKNATYIKRDNNKIIRTLKTSVYTLISCL